MKLEAVLRSLGRKEPLTFEEIGLVLGMKRQNVWNTYVSAMRKMRARLKLVGIE
jgi:DNA-directed RNA polymerase sigma subunit (sigma70/sigma32)